MVQRDEEAAVGELRVVVQVARPHHDVGGHAVALQAPGGGEGFPLPHPESEQVVEGVGVVEAVGEWARQVEYACQGVPVGA